MECLRRAYMGDAALKLPPAPFVPMVPASCPPEVAALIEEELQRSPASRSDAAALYLGGDYDSMASADGSEPWRLLPLELPRGGRGPGAEDPEALNFRAAEAAKRRRLVDEELFEETEVWSRLEAYASFLAAVAEWDARPTAECADLGADSSAEASAQLGGQLDDFDRWVCSAAAATRRRRLGASDAAGDGADGFESGAAGGTEDTAPWTANLESLERWLSEARKRRRLDEDAGVLSRAGSN
eukprot:TRINITY_DN13869_c0_g1_i1.p2 TRINITY_DN13869_c0_g1~~TRINITY_DN13869_c0_g1_i1.p2  ORF type:complete len:242 (-),score=78.38 TRINITY_DN13869_c0_g1_i1:62-787(-)